MTSSYKQIQALYPYGPCVSSTTLLEQYNLKDATWTKRATCQSSSRVILHTVREPAQWRAQIAKHRKSDEATIWFAFLDDWLSPKVLLCSFRQSTTSHTSKAPLTLRATLSPLDDRAQILAVTRWRMGLSSRFQMPITTVGREHEAVLRHSRARDGVVRYFWRRKLK